MTVMAARTIEATYEKGLLRPMEPIQDVENQIYLVTIINLSEFHAKMQLQSNQDWRGKYRGFLSSSEEFSRAKQAEKTLEL